MGDGVEAVENSKMSRGGLLAQKVYFDRNLENFIFYFY